jgi:hypothetical protein
MRDKSIAGELATNRLALYDDALTANVAAGKHVNAALEASTSPDSPDREPT